MKEFNREKVFASVDESNKRFENYSDEERRKFHEEAKKQFRSRTDASSMVEETKNNQ